MQLALKLGKDELEIFSWPKDRFELWVAFFRVQAEREKNAKPAG